MSVEENKALVLRFWEQFSKGNFEVIDECLAENFVRYGIDGKVMDREGYRQLCTGFSNTYPGIQGTVGDIVAEGDKVAFYFTLAGTHKSESTGNPPRRKRFTMVEAYFSRIEGGKIVEFRNFQAQRQDQ